MTSTSLARARVATLAGPGNASRLWPKGRFARAWVPAYDPYESDDSPSPPTTRPTLHTAVSRARVGADAQLTTAQPAGTKSFVGLGLTTELFPASLHGTPISGVAPLLPRTWVPAPRAESPIEDYTYEDAYSPVEVALARVSEASYFPSPSAPPLTTATVRAHPPTPVAPMSLAGPPARRPGLQRMPTFATPRVLTVATFVPELCTAFALAREREQERSARFELGFGFLISPRAPRAGTPEPFAFPTVLAREEGPYMLDDSPFTPSVDVFERSPAEAPLDLFAQDFATSPGPSPFLGILPPSNDAEGDSAVSPGELELHEFPLAPDLFDRSADESGGETLQRPDSPVDALSGDYMFGVYL